MKPNPLVKLDWIDRAIQVHNYHIRMLRDEPQWTIEKSAISLNRSIGSVSNDIQVACWCRTHEKQLRRLNSMKDALEFIKTKKKEMYKEIDI